MNTLIRSRLWLPLVVLLLAPVARAQGGEDVDVQTSGPVHEGFANPTVFEDSSEPYYVDVDPPTLIEEAPPQERPHDTEWVPGYWSYEDESRQWMWISGTWRATPPGYVWVSGYWIKTWKGWRYVRGYWAPVGYGGEIEYLPAPPPTLESGPIGYAPYGNAIWIPGTWIWVSGGYMGWMWQPGYWIVYNTDWTWVPASYVWTPYGYIFVPGHYDHSCEHRGYLYAPVCFPRHSYLTAGFSYSPSFVINVSIFSGCFFSRPAYSHYYFGDYYSQTCWNRGIYPAFSFQYSKHGYDPIYAHANVRYGKSNPKWAEVQRSEYLVRRDDVTKRPAKTLREQRSKPEFQIAVLAKDADDRATVLKKERVPDSDRPKLIEHAREMRTARQQRVKAEASNVKEGDKLPDNPRRVKSQGFVPGFMSNKAKETETLAVTPKAPDVPKRLERPEEAKLDPRRPTRRLRDPSLDLPAAGKGDDTPAGKKPDDVPGRKPGDDVGGKKPGDDTPGRRPPFGKPGDDAPTGGKKPADDVPGRKPGDDVGGKKPDDTPGRRPPFGKPGDDAPTGGKKPADDVPSRKPGDDVGGKKPDVIRPPARKPDDVPTGGKKPEDTQPGGRKPGDVPTGGNKPGNEVPGRRPADDVGGKKPGDVPTGGNKPGNEVPGRRPPITKPADGQGPPPTKKPEDTQPGGKKPEDAGRKVGGQPQGQPNDPRGNPPKPGERRPKPGEPGFKPGEQVPESQPVKKPPRNEKEKEKEKG